MSDTSDALIVGEDLARVLSPDRKPEPPGAIQNVLTFGWRALLKVKHMPEQLFDVIVTPIMFTVMFTYLFGGALAGSPDAYIQFLLPGILVQTVTFTTIYTGFTLNSDISKGIFDRFRSIPIWRASPIVGAMAGDTVRYTLSSLIVIVIGFILGFRPEAGLARRRRLADPPQPLRLRHELDLRGAGADRPHPLGGDDDELAGADAAHLRLQHLRRSRDHAGVAPGLHRRQPGGDPGHRRPRPDGGHGDALRRSASR